MSLSQILTILKARYKLAFFILICTVAAAAAISAYLPKRYTASTSLVVDSMNRDPLSAMLLPGSLGFFFMPVLLLLKWLIWLV